MLTASSLRTSNILLCDGTPRIVTAEDILSCERDAESFNRHWKGVELSEEVLMEWCGYTIEPTPYNDWSLVGTASLGDFILYQYNDGFGWDTGIGHVTDLSFLHQLQSLYHALTGHELTIKLPI